MGSEQRGIQQFPREIGLFEILVDQITRNRRQQEGQDTQQDDRFLIAFEHFEIRFHPGEHHQEQQSERTERIDERHGMGLDLFRTGSEEGKQRRDMSDQVDAVFADEHSGDQQGNHHGDLEPPQEKRNQGHQCDQYQK